VLVVWVISLGIIVFQRDLGTGTLIFGMFVAMLYVATGKTSWVLIGLSVAGAPAVRPLSCGGGRSRDAGSKQGASHLLCCGRSCGSGGSRDAFPGSKQGASHLRVLPRERAAQLVVNAWCRR